MTMQQRIACPSINTYSGEGQFIFTKNALLTKILKKSATFLKKVRVVDEMPVDLTI